MSFKLIETITSKKKHISELSQEEGLALIKTSIFNDDFRALQVITNEVTGIFDYDEHKPYWLNSTFHEDCWSLTIDSWNKQIRFDDVVLSDGEKLTSDKHRPLLNNFKYWLTALDNPLENGGQLQKPKTVQVKITLAIQLINALILNSDAINLHSRHFECLTEDTVMAILCRVAESGVDNGIYDYHMRLRAMLLNKIKTIDDDEAQAFKTEFPHVSRHLIEDEITLALSVDERVKACLWLYKNDFYKKKNRASLTTPQNSKLAHIFFQGKILCIENIVFPKILELEIKETRLATEYRSIPNHDVSKKMSIGVIKQIIPVFKSLFVTQYKPGTSKVPIDAFKMINLQRIQNNVEVKPIGRSQTLPAPMILNIIKQAFEFCFEHTDAILESVFNALEHAPKERSQIRAYHKNKAMTVTTTKVWKQHCFKTHLTDATLKLGVTIFSIQNNNPQRFHKRRNNEGLIDLYNILVGSIQVLTGAFMARRQNELVKLKPTKNLTSTLDPDSILGENTDYSLIFENGKSGNGGQYSSRETLDRPIPRSIALLISKLERFNQKIIDAGIQPEKKLGLFNTINAYHFTISKPNGDSYNNKLDAFCDYFETDLVDFGRGDIRRYYIRQHQNRRFFAMIFFWSKSFAGLDVLRHFLGHTDMEHLYHYVTEEQPGEVLNGVKASALVDSVIQQGIDNIEDLNKALSKRFGTNFASITITSISEAIDDFDNDDDYKVTPIITEIRQQTKLENQILELLNDQVIEFEPEFFTIRNEDGSERQDYKFILRVKELD